MFGEAFIAQLAGIALAARLTIDGIIARKRLRVIHAQAQALADNLAFGHIDNRRVNADASRKFLPPCGGG